jgi:hypothetical protein
MTLTLPQRAAVQQQVLRRPAPSPPQLIRRFTAWCGSSISPAHRTIDDLAIATYALVPLGVWDEIELLLKAGEGGTYQAAFDSHRLAIDGPVRLLSHIQAAKPLGLRITPYVVVRARSAWIAGEQQMIRQCVRVAGRCVLNVEPGAPYYNGPNDPGFIRGYLAGIGVDPSTLEVCLIPRQTQIDELGGPACIQAWTDPTLVGGASWETYDGVAPGTGADSLRPDVAIPRLDQWGVPPDLRYRLCVVQRNRIGAWAETIWAAQGLEAWHLDGDI